MDNALPKADALVINNSGIIEAVGTESEMRKQFAAFSNETNFHGQTMLPGLNDAHIHVWKIGLQLWVYVLQIINLII